MKEIKTFEEYDDELAYKFSALCEGMINTEGYLNLTEAFNEFDRRYKNESIQ